MAQRRRHIYGRKRIAADGIASAAGRSSVDANGHDGGIVGSSPRRRVCTTTSLRHIRLIVAGIAICGIRSDSQFRQILPKFKNQSTMTMPSADRSDGHCDFHDIFLVCFRLAPGGIHKHQRGSWTVRANGW
jgi:hypothetical protein